jgi:hypothetical protein
LKSWWTYESTGMDEPLLWAWDQVGNDEEILIYFAGFCAATNRPAKGSEIALAPSPQNWT